MQKYLALAGQEATRPGLNLPRTQVQRHARHYPDYERFKEFYFDRLVNFAEDAIRWEGEDLTSYQRDVLQRFPQVHRATVRAPHGAGKTALSALAILWFALTRDGGDWKALTTAGSWRQLYVYLWPEIHKWARRLRWEIVGRPPFDRDELLQTKLQLTTGAATAVASNKPELLEGAHADQILYLFDESKSIGADTFDAAEGAFSGGAMGEESDVRSAESEAVGRRKYPLEAFALSISTPGEPYGRFYDIHSRKPGFEDWWVRHVTLEEAQRAGRITRQWAEQRKAMWGESSAVYQNKVRGEFCVQEESGVIPLAWIEEAMERHDAITQAIAEGKLDEPPLTLLSADIAYSGSNQTAIARFRQDYVEAIETALHVDTMTTAGKLMGICRSACGVSAAELARLSDSEQRQRLRRVKVVVDVIGVGAGVYDRCKEQGAHAIPFNAAEKTDRTDRTGELEMLNRRSAAWWGLREALDPTYFPTLCLPRDDRLLTELKLPKWKQNSTGKIVVESKDDIARRLNTLNAKSKSEQNSTSTDLADTIVMGLFMMTKKQRPPMVAPVSIERVSAWR